MLSKGFARRFLRAAHRDLGYFFSSLIIIYCLSGIALNHIDSWDPDFILYKETVMVPAALRTGALDPSRLTALAALAPGGRYKVYDIPAPGHVKFYYEDATLHLRLDDGVGSYERMSRRPLFFQANVLHRNSFKTWKWGSDVFAIALVVITVSGLLILKGRHGITRRGKWLLLSGAVPPLVVLLLYG